MKIATHQEGDMRMRIFANLFSLRSLTNMCARCTCKGSFFNDKVCDLEVAKSSFYCHGASRLSVIQLIPLAF